MEKYFLENEIFGQLVLRDVLVSYDYPRIFICENKLGVKFIFAESDSDDAFDEWVVVPLSNGKYYQIITNQLDLKSALLNSEDTNFYLVKRVYDSGITETKASKEPFMDKVTEYKVFVGNRDNEAERTHDIIKSSMDLGTPLMDIVLFPRDHAIKDVDSIILESLCSSFRHLFEKINNHRCVRVSTLTGSFVVRFNLNDPTNLFSQTDAEKTINKVNKILSQPNSEDVYRELDGNVEVVSSYKEALGVLGKVGNDVTIVSATPSSSFPEIKPITQEFVKDSIKNLDAFYNEEINHIVEKGRLVVFDKIHQKFSLISSNEEKQISGKYMDSAYPEGFTYTIDKNYSCELDEISMKNTESCKEEKGYPKYILKSAKLID